MPITLPTLDFDFFSAFMSIIFVDIVLSGDNAVLIAMAVRNLPPRKRKIGIAFGAGMAVLLRVVLTFFAAQLMGIHYVKLIGGILIAWIGIKLFIEGNPDETSSKECSTLTQAVGTIMVADLAMSLDNVLAVAGASKGDYFLLLFGLGLSIPIVMFASNMVSKFMDRYPVVIYLGAAVLGKVAAEMILTDPFVVESIQPSHAWVYAAEAMAAVGVVLVGKAWLRVMALRPARIKDDTDRR